MKLSANEILKGATDCTIDGLSSKFDYLNLHFGDININDVKNTDAVLVERVMFGEESNYIITGEEYKTSFGEIRNMKSTPMFGGNFLYSSHSAFPSRSPIKIFDRYEA